MAEQTSQQNTAPKRRRLRGEIVSTAMQDTVVVAVVSHVKHSKYGKYLKQVKRYKAHDESGKRAVGDQVTIEETKPISKHKRFRVVA